MNIQLQFTAKQIAIMEMMAPPLTATEVCQKVLDDWFTSNRDRMYKQVKTDDQINDEVIVAKVDKPK